jgi:hypothetical protein
MNNHRYYKFTFSCDCFKIIQWNSKGWGFEMFLPDEMGQKKSKEERRNWNNK